MKTSFRIVLAIIAIAFCCCEKDPTFRVIALDNTKITATSTATTAKITYNLNLSEEGKYDNGSIRSCYLRYSDRPATSFNNMTYYNTLGQDIRYSGSDYFLLEDLRPNTTYYYALRLGDMYSAVKTFKTTGITVETGTATDITTSSAKLSGKCTLNGAKLQESGILVHTSSSMSYTNYTKRASGTYTNFNATITGLMSNTTYYYCAYAKDSEGYIYYGDVKNFKTVNQPIRSAKTAVDLGLSVKWAAGNVGATDETNYGQLYAWGETTTKSSYVWGTYLYCNYKNDWSGMTKYTIADGQTSGSWYSYGTFIGDNKRTLTLSDDAANANWGGNWRMPTESELSELANNCSWEWVTFHGMQGFWIVGPNGNSIFLPAAGWKSGTETHTLGVEGFYWTSSLSTYSDWARAIFISSGSSRWESKDRFYGFAVRPVCP